MTARASLYVTATPPSPSVGETRVDLLHLLEDLADAYPGDLEETVLTEIVANALDSGASAIVLRADPAAATLVVIDDGVGMRRAELRRYHDVAASAKTRDRCIPAPLKLVRRSAK